jgi:hypothetical protein
MKMLLRALSAESLKLKRTLALWLVAGAPMVVILLTIFVVLNMARNGAHVDIMRAMNQGPIGVWAVFMLPLFIVLETALVSGIDHNSKSWKHIYALPVPRWTIYIAKLLMGLALITASSIVFWLGLVTTGLVLRLLWPESYMINVDIWLGILQPLAIIWLAALLIVALHTWITIRWSSFALTTGIGVAGVFFALFAASAWVGKYYPWLLPLNSRSPDREAIALTLGIAGGIIVSILGCWEVTRRDVL